MFDSLITRDISCLFDPVRDRAIVRPYVCRGDAIAVLRSERFEDLFRQVFDQAPRKIRSTVQIPEESIAPGVAPCGDLVLEHGQETPEQGSRVFPRSMCSRQYLDFLFDGNGFDLELDDGSFFFGYSTVLDHLVRDIAAHHLQQFHLARCIHLKRGFQIRIRKRVIRFFVLLRRKH